jgi:hypothetical protein
MIKYVEIDGYKNYGEVHPFSHLYQFVQDNTECPMIILVHAYDPPEKVFKGYLFNSDKTYQNIPLTSEESEKIEYATGKLEEVDFMDFFKDSSFEEQFKDYTMASR